jgi:hypothetical protein
MYIEKVDNYLVIMMATFRFFNGFFFFFFFSLVPKLFDFCNLIIKCYKILNLIITNFTKKKKKTYKLA